MKKLLGISIALALTAGAAYAVKISYICLERDAKGDCIREQYWEDGYLVQTCTAPPKGECTATAVYGKKKAVCSGKDGQKCEAMVRTT